MAPTYRHVTVAGSGGSPNGGTNWGDAFDFAEWISDIETNAAADWYYFVKQDTYSFAGAPLDGIDCSAVDGTYLLPIHVIGVKSGTTNVGAAVVPSDWAFNDDRPLIAAGAFPFLFNNYWRIFNLRVTTDHASGLKIDTGCIAWNCKVAATSTRAIHNVGSGTRIISCEASNSGGKGIEGGSAALRVIGCYIHDCTDDIIFINNSTGVLLFNLFDTAPTGFDMSIGANHTVFGNTFYNCALAIDGTADPVGHLYMNNIIDSSGTRGADWSANVGNNFWDYNNWKNNADDENNVTKGPNTLALQPQFVDAAGGNFLPRAWQSILGFPGQFPGGLSNGAGLIVGAVQPRRAVNLVGSR